MNGPATCADWNLDFSDHIGTILATCEGSAGHDGPHVDRAEGVAWNRNRSWRIPKQRG